MPRPSRPWWQRLAALCLAVWFAVATADLPALHTCVMHGGAADWAAAANAMTMATPHAMADAHAHPGAHASAHPDAANHAPAHGGPHAAHLCTCLGACCGAALLEPPAPAALTLAATTAQAPVAPGRPAHEYVAAWVDFVLPFSTAPPAQTIA